MHTMFRTPQFGPWSYDIPVIETAQTPIGQRTSTVRWCDGFLYARLNALILPNFSRVPDISFDFATERPSAKRDGVSLWTVPYDNTNCAMIGWMHLSVDMDAAAREKCAAMFGFGQDGSRPYEERHRLPGDWDAWVSQGTYAIHENEHLVHSDGAIKLFRKQLRQGIKPVQTGKDPKGIVQEPNRDLIRSYGCKLTKSCPTAPAESERQKQLGAFSRDAIAASLAGETEGFDGPA